MQSQVKARKKGNYFNVGVCFSYPQKFIELKDDLLKEAELCHVTFVSAEIEHQNPSTEFMEGEEHSWNSEQSRNIHRA